MTTKKDQERVIDDVRKLEGKCYAKDWAALHRAQKKLERKELKGAMKAEAERIKDGGVNYALMNYILTINTKLRNVDQYIHTYLDAVRAFYESIFGIQNKLVDQLIFFRLFTLDLVSGEHIDAKRIEKMIEYLETEADPQVEAREALARVQEQQRKRAKSKIIANSEIIS